MFKDPRDFLTNAAMHRVGTSYHLPNGGAVYFDTGVVEMVTPAMELERGTAVRAARSLWENIALVRRDLDRWEQRRGHRVQLAGFSTHYNVSVAARGGRRLDRLARLLTYVLPVPLMLLAANRRSTGIGVRPRVTRVEVTADFTPDPALQVAAATVHRRRGRARIAMAQLVAGGTAPPRPAGDRRLPAAASHLTARVARKGRLLPAQSLRDLARRRGLGHDRGRLPRRACGRWPHACSATSAGASDASPTRSRCG